MSMTPFEQAWKNLETHASYIETTHLRELLKDDARTEDFIASFEGMYLDYSRQRATQKTRELLIQLAESAGLKDKINALFRGDKINTTEKRSVLHMALRFPPNKQLVVDGQDVTADVHGVLEKIADLADRVRSGAFQGKTGKMLTNVISIGIGGSYLGPEFVYEALRFDPQANSAASGRRLRFLANVDPVDVARALDGFDPETTLVVIVSKTFTTAETMLNARTVRDWLVRALGSDAVASHMIAVSTNIEGVKEFGISPENIYEFWDWVGGRFSVCSAVGMVPLSLHYGFDLMRKFLDGAHSVDEHFRSAPLTENLPVLLGLFGVWNASFLKYPTRALLPYSQALHKFAPHIQQVDMESNGKRVDINGIPLNYETGEVNFGEPGTNGQHSFYQLMHQGRVIPADFIGFCTSQHPVHLEGEGVSSHDELMSNFFAQPDALAYGKTEDQLRAEGVPDTLIGHKEFPGNRPSSMLLLDRLDAYHTGQLLALYEHRTAVQGFIWNINSFDQWGVELGKVLAKAVRKQMQDTRTLHKPVQGFNKSTSTILSRYLQRSSK
eukprot:TRINITY_DN18625_c0_g1::TRINITY_DN18625_c0_g1_i1::g.1123::m.1123 TRINITY_DN18625_c0_g1::TRINITY_DN18625_c0_g1_i1::g.1123  ORF type:complete len:568 (+),score=158.19,sp/P54236/G6PI1_CLAFR/64.04/0.0,PGI/PF00342.14/9.1e-195,SPRY/PF00622.23/0.15 TRINITY_DN18625_c0_g1_i1:45-1706(+)